MSTCIKCIDGIRISRRGFEEPPSFQACDLSGVLLHVKVRDGQLSRKAVSWLCCRGENTGGALVWCAGGGEHRSVRKGLWGNKLQGGHCRTWLDERSEFVATWKLGLHSFSSCFQADQLTFTSWASERHRKKKLPQGKCRSRYCRCTQWIKTWGFADSISFSVHIAGILCLIFPRCGLTANIQLIKRPTLAHYHIIFVTARGFTHRLKNCKIDRGKGVLKIIQPHFSSFDSSVTFS